MARSKPARGVDHVVPAGHPEQLAAEGAARSVRCGPGRSDRVVVADDHKQRADGVLGTACRSVEAGPQGKA